jgi:tripartite-type tricarboxylate transporter receptor subunit TctC
MSLQDRIEEYIFDISCGSSTRSPLTIQQNELAKAIDMASGPIEWRSNGRVSMRIQGFRVGFIVKNFSNYYEELKKGVS